MADPIFSDVVETNDVKVIAFNYVKVEGMYNGKVYCNHGNSFRVQVEELPDPDSPEGGIMLKLVDEVKGAAFGRQCKAQGLGANPYAHLERLVINAKLPVREEDGYYHAKGALYYRCEGEQEDLKKDGIIKEDVTGYDLPTAEMLTLSQIVGQLVLSMHSRCTPNEPQMVGVSWQPEGGITR